MEGQDEMRAAERKGREGYAKGAKGHPRKLLDSFFSFASFAQLLRLLRSAVRIQRRL
jgi:hypothetical protein